MCDNKILSKLADIPLAKPGFDALGITAPVMVALNPEGKWEKKPPGNLDEDRLKAIIAHLVKSNAVSAAQSYCCQCCEDSQNGGGKSNYVPVIMMPIYPADQCPFDLECEAQKLKENETKSPKKTKGHEQPKDSEKEKAAKKPKKRTFVMQRLTDFDLLSQW
ncbi:uncharacterized protein LOC126380165 [Pectinophora gossypiella]|uniref:uncharacterized protein LOC126380165 n=1 Tax=Pectinophora gossypiella TaxID=13191 RepID=UPI00214EFB08|nr:uncharacterized protein LOC126380165 [Pectinophora gossypiella]